VEVWVLVSAKPRNFTNNSQVKIENPRKVGFGNGLGYKMFFKFAKIIVNHPKTHHPKRDAYQEILYGVYLGENHPHLYNFLLEGASSSTSISKSICEFEILFEISVGIVKEDENELSTTR